MTASRRARATIAFFIPRRLAICIAQALSQDHEGAQPEFGTFRTAPRGRARFTFTSFGDQGTPTLGRRYVPPAGTTVPNPPYVNDNLGSPAAGAIKLPDLDTKLEAKEAAERLAVTRIVRA
jgi:hypothetical protein